jgi:hypothetical protein
MGICEDKVTHITEEDWKRLCKKLKLIEREYLEAYRVVDDTRAKFFIPLESECDSESDSGNDDSNSA